MYKCRDKIDNTIQKEAKYVWEPFRQLIRLFKIVNLDKITSIISLLIVNLLFPSHATIFLVMDRTNWKFGNHHINVLVLGFLFHNNSIFIPLVWNDLETKYKRGTYVKRIKTSKPFTDNEIATLLPMHKAHKILI